MSRARAKGEIKEKKRKDDGDGDSSFMRGTISPVASNPKRRKRGEKEMRQWTIVKSRPSMSMRISSPNFPCWKTMRAPAALATPRQLGDNGGGKCGAAVVLLE